MKIYNCLAALFLLGCMALTASAADTVTLTVHVHDGSLDGDLLSGVSISGTDAAGNEFGAITDSDGIAVINGVPGNWTFTFELDGYDPLYLKYDAISTEDTAAYLEKSS
jgi:hypothetical protein